MAKRKESLELTLIENCVIRSRSIIIAKAYLLSLKEAKFFAHRYKKVLPQTESLTSLIDSLYLSIQEDAQTIAKMLSPLLRQYRVFIDEKEGFWFTHKDFRRGYIEFSRPSDETSVCVLVLANFKSDFLEFKAGEIHPYETIKEFLKDAGPIPGCETLILRHSIRKLKKHG